MGSALGAAKLEKKMRVTKFKMKFLGKACTLFRVLDAKGEVLHVAETEQEAQNWIDAQ